MSFSYRDEGDSVIVDATATAACTAVAALTASPEQVVLFKQIEALAQRNVEETGRACDVFAVDGSTLLVRKRPT